jgi:hypothetical protein
MHELIVPIPNTTTITIAPCHTLFCAKNDPYKFRVTNLNCMAIKIKDIAIDTTIASLLFLLTA